MFYKFKIYFIILFVLFLSLIILLLKPPYELYKENTPNFLKTILKKWLPKLKT